MFLLLVNVIFLFIVPRIFCGSESIILEGENQSGSSLSDILRKKIDSARVVFNDEKTSEGDSFARDRGQVEFKELKQNERKYDEQDTARKGHDKGRHSLGESEVIDQGRNAFERHGSGYYKKGHHRTGFTNNYHKDESGNNSSFYEDSDDEGGHRSSGNTGVYYGQKSRDAFRDGARDASYTERDRTQQGSYDNRQNYNDYHDHTGGYLKDRYKDNRKNYLQDETGRYFDRNGNEIYYRREKMYPTFRHNNNYFISPFKYSHYDMDFASRNYYTDDPYDVFHSKNDRYFPIRRLDYEHELLYPYREHYDKNYPGDFYDNEYMKKYRTGFNRKYYRF